VPGVRAYPLPIAFDNARLVNCSFAAPSSSSSSSSSSTSASVANPSAPNIVACTSFFLAVEHSSGNGSISASIPNLSAALARFGAYAHEGLLRFTPGRIETVLVRQNRLPEAARAWAAAQVAVSGADGHVGSTAGTGVGAGADVGAAAGATTQHRRRRNRERHADANANATLNGASITASEHATAETAHDGSSAHESHANINARTAALDCSPHLTAMGGAQICSTPLAPLLHLSASAISSSSTIPSSAAASSLTTGLSPYVNLMSLERPSNGARSSIGASGVGRGMSMPGTPRDTIAAATHSHGHAHQTAPLSSSKKRKARPTEVQMLQSQSPLSGGAESVSLSGVGANSSSSSSASLDLAQPSARGGGSFHGVGARSANAHLRVSLAKHAHHTANSAAAMAGESYVDEAANAQRKMARPKKSPKISPDSQ
jgi:hypothetical protein